MRMKKITLLFIMTLLLAGCGFKTATADEASEVSISSEAEYKRVSLFCDVEFWDAPIWDISEETISGAISKETGAVIEVIDKMDDADRQLSMMLVNDNLPDIISVTDETVISQLVTSDKVWKLDEFLETYKPDSHLLETFPGDIKYELIKRDGGWYAYPSHMSSPDNRKYWTMDEYYLKKIEYSWSYMIMWNKDLLEELGLDINELQTEDAVLSAFQAAKNAKQKLGRK